VDEKILVELLPIAAISAMAGTVRVFFDSKSKTLDKFIRQTVTASFAGILAYVSLKYYVVDPNAYAQVGTVASAAFCSDDILTFLVKLLKNPSDFLDWWQSRNSKP